MPQPGGNEVTRSAYKRAWVQRGGPRITNPVQYAGEDGAYVEVGDLTNPLKAITREQVASTSRLGGYDTVAVLTGPAEFATNQVMFKNKRGYIPWLDYAPGCPFNLYEPIGFCRNPADFSGGWETGVDIYSYGEATQWTRQANAKFAEDVAESYQGDVTWTGGAYRVGQIAFGEVAASSITRQVVDVAYADAYDCGLCGSGNDGTQWAYILQQDDNASTGVKADVLYSTDGGATWTSSPITSLGGNDLVTAMDVMSGYLIVLSSTGNAYHYAAIDEVTGAPGTWTAVTGGFVAAKTPNDIYVRSPREAFIAANGGYVYRLSTIGAAVEVLNAGATTTNNLSRIHGSGAVILAVGASGTTIKSSNQGRTWAATTASLGVADTVQAVACIDVFYYLVGTSAGNAYYTLNGGASWATLAFSGSGSGAVYDIIAPTPEVIWFSHSATGPDARIFASITGGAIFDLSTLANQRRMVGLPTFDIANRLAAPKVGTLGQKANNLLIGGLGGNGSDGIALLGVPSVDFS